jgi:hypothetical protein
MSTPRGSGQGQVPQRPGSDPAVEALLEYLATTAVTPPADLTARIHARIAREPDRTPPRRYALALLHLRLGTAAGAFRQLMGVAGGRGTFPGLIRVQALGLVLVTVLAAAALAAGAAVGVTKLVQEQRSTHPTPPTQTILPGPTAKPTPRRSDDLASPAPSPSDTLHLLVAPDPTPSRTPHPSRTPRPQDLSGADATPHPAKTQKPSHPEPTRTPRPTPRKTPKPARTPRPTERPERTDRPEPTETPEAGDNSGKGGNGPGESEAPHSGGKGSVWPGDVWFAGLVPPWGSGPAEGHA